MAFPPAAECGSTTIFHSPSARSPSEILTEGGEATYWPELRDAEVCAEPWENTGANSATDHRSESPPREVIPLIHLPKQGATARQFQILQQWEGVVTRVDGDWFEADLCDLTAPNNPLEMAEFPFADISPSDKHLICPGCVFYWVIGYETRKGGQVTRSSEIRVRRSPRWTQRRLNALKSQARELFTLEGEDGQNATQPK